MTVLEKTIDALSALDERQIENVYSFIISMNGAERPYTQEPDVPWQPGILPLDEGETMNDVLMRLGGCLAHLDDGRPWDDVRLEAMRERYGFTD